MNYRAKKLVKGRREGERGASGRSVKDVVGHSLKPSDQVKERKAAEGQNFLLSLPPLLGVHTMSFQESPFMCSLCARHIAALYTLVSSQFSSFYR